MQTPEKIVTADNIEVDLNYLNTVELLPGADNYLYDHTGSVSARPGMMTIAHGGCRFKSVP